MYPTGQAKKTKPVLLELKANNFTEKDVWYVFFEYI